MTTTMTMDQVQHYAPAAFAKRPSRRVSEKYGFIPTTDLIAALQKAGFTPVSAKSQRAYKGGDNDQFGRHVLRFRSSANSAKPAVGDVVPEVIIINSHNGRTRFVVRAGLFRLVCSNGMTVATHNFGEINVKHSPGVLEDVTKAAAAVIKDAAASTKVVEAMMRVKLDEKSALAFARKAIAIRFRKEKEEVCPVSADQILTVRRPEDAKMDLWHVFNIVQENLTKGGMEGAAASGRRVTMRQLTSCTRDATVNFNLWQLALGDLNKAGKMPALTSALATKDDTVQ